MFVSDRVQEMIEFLEENGVRVDVNDLTRFRTEEQQFNLLNKIFREKVA
ncbi:MAG: hypothetical protein N0C84_00745 [Candidatus Thiodiazotropha taylori]|uniref:Uncharacterized protein n=1 Tax=Candidatus Thiodiazotropha taylori TaxID=2792791 RepID=A0A9E4K9G7_9GAMM|nr:hypothetical protein [Candidatus Thiodiazotropha taylori]MCW4254973.1 hypothetical protein [Candidatus Thiodiazotropha taylori]